MGSMQQQISAIDQITNQFNYFAQQSRRLPEAKEQTAKISLESDEYPGTSLYSDMSNFNKDS